MFSTGVATRQNLLSPLCGGEVEKGGITDFGVCGLPPSLTLPHKGRGNGEDKPGHDELRDIY
jgi:hypothetical protein